MYKVLLPGEALIDKFNIDGKIEEKVGGAPANVAAAISKLGITANFIGTVGNDVYGNLIKNTLVKNGVGVDGLVVVEKPTTVANVSVDADGERSFTFNRGADELLKVEDIPQSLLNDYGILHLGSATAMLGGPLWDSYLKLLEISNDKIIVFDPNYRDALYSEVKSDFIKKSKYLCTKADIVKLSQEELKILTDEEDYLKGAKKILELGPKVILITLGKEGTYLLTNKHSKVVPSVEVKQIDTTGAGDSFIGYLIGEISKKELSKNELDQDEIVDLIRKANICASITVTRIGAFEAIPTSEEVETIFNQNN